MRYFTAAATALAVGAFVLPVAAAASDSGSTSTRIVVVEKASPTIADLGGKGVGPGDRLSYTSVLRRSGGAKAGVGSGDCVVLTGSSEQDALYQCTGIYRFGSAQLSVAGLFGGGVSKGVWTITGGTGKWAGAHGQLPFSAISADTYRLDFRFDV